MEARILTSIPTPPPPDSWLLTPDFFSSETTPTFISNLNSEITPNVV